MISRSHNITSLLVSLKIRVNRPIIKLTNHKNQNPSTSTYYIKQKPESASLAIFCTVISEPPMKKSDFPGGRSPGGGKTDSALSRLLITFHEYFQNFFEIEIRVSPPQGPLVVPFAPYSYSPSDLNAARGCTCFPAEKTCRPSAAVTRVFCRLSGFSPFRHVSGPR